MATINGDSTDNTLTGTSDADVITGNAGNDSITGGDGNDVIEGGGASIVPEAMVLDWTAAGANGADLSAGFTQNLGSMSVAVGLTNDGAGTTATVSTSGTYVDTGEPFDANSNLALRGDGGADTWTTTFDFSANSSAVSDEAENVQFRIQDVDQSGWQDIITVLAFDAQGNPVDVTMTPAGDDTVAGNTVTAGASSTGASDAAGSVLVAIAGPVAQVQVIYENGGTSGQLLYLTDLHFEAVATDDDVIDGQGGDDTLFGGVGADAIEGGAGDDSIGGGSGRDSLSGGNDSDTISGDGGADTLFGGSGSDSLSGGADHDTLYGGSGFDTLDGGSGNDTLFGGNGNDRFFAQGGDSVVGGEGGTDTGDILVVNDVDRVEFNPTDSEAGTVYFNDGTTLNFIEIEQLEVNGGPTGTVEGTQGSDLIDASYVDNQLEQVDNNDGTLGTTGDQDVIAAGAGNDTVFGGAANDTVYGGVDALTPQAEALSWISQGSGTNVLGGFSQETGTATIDVVITNDGGLTQATTSGVAQYVAGTEPMSTTSSLSLGGNGAADVASVVVSSDLDMENVQFRINDIDSGSWQDILTVTALGPDGSPVAVTLTAAGDDTVAGQTVTGGPVNDDANLANGSVLVTIAGPVSSFEITYQNGSTGGQIVYVTDVHFDAVPVDDDTLHGDAGDDTLFGQIGQDVLYGGADNDVLDGGVDADSLYGGSGDDTLIAGSGDDRIEGGDDADTITFADGFNTDSVDGGEGGDDLDTLDFTAHSGPVAIDFTADEAGSGTAGTDAVGFTNIERVVGTGQGDTLDATLSNLAQTLEAEAGADVVLGGGGDDAIFGGTGGDTLTGGAGNDALYGGADADLIALSGTLDDDQVFGGSTGADNDTLDLSSVTEALTVDLTSSNPENGTVSSATSDVTFDDIETLVLGAGDDTLVLGNGSGSDRVEGFAAPTANGDGTFTGVDVLDVADLDDAGGQPVNTHDVTVDDDGSGNAVLSFPNGETLTLVGIPPAVADDPFWLNAIGVPLPDGTVSGTAGDDLIDASFVGDPDGDRVDADDAILAGDAGNDDLIEAGAGQDSILAGLGSDEVYGGTGNDTIDGEGGKDTLYGGDGNDVILSGFDDGTGDVMFGGDGIDEYRIIGSATQNFAYDVDLTTGSDQYNNSLTGIENVTGGLADDRLTGDSGTNVLSGEAGADTLDGGDGDDTLFGGDDQDLFVLEDGFGTDVIAGGEGGSDADTVNANGVTNPITVSFTGDEAGTLSNGTNTATFSEIESIIGSQAGDTMDATGSSVGQTLAGEEGDDTLTGGTGADVLRGGDDADVIYAGGGDTVFGGSGGTDFDTLVLNEFGTTITYADGDPESGTVEFADGSILSFSDIENIVPCFTPGTKIRTDRGDVAIETLAVGDLILTKDSGLQPIAWIGMRTVDAPTLAASPELRPVRVQQDAIAPGVPARDMLVSPQHRMLVDGPEVQLWLGQDEVLVKAKDMVHRPGIALSEVEEVTYIHLMCATHQIVLADGAWTESFQPGDMINGGDREMFDELIALFPDLAHIEGRRDYVAARLSAKWHEARLVC